jgi:hypothetical protein
MSFQNYEPFQGQPGGEQTGAPAGAGAPAQQPDMGQPLDNGAGGFATSNMGPPGGAGLDQQQGGEGKTTLW